MGADGHATAVPKPGEATLRDLFAHEGMRAVILIWSPMILILFAGALLTASSVWTVLAGLAYGLFVYSFMEYVTHRWLYHWEPRQRLWRALNARLGPPHLRHHEKPTHYRGAIMLNQLPIVAIMLACLGGLLLLPVPLAFSFAAIGIGSLGFVVHEGVHFGCHQMAMRNPVAAYLKRRHLFHHYRDDNFNFGTTSPLWDIVLGTNYVPGRTSRAKAFGRSRATEPAAEARDEAA